MQPSTSDAEHRLYHFLLAFSGREHAHVFLGGEVSRRRRIGCCQACSGVNAATTRTTAVVIPIAIQKRAEFVASSISQRWVGEKLSTEPEEAFCKLRLRRCEGAFRVGGRRADHRARRRCSRSRRRWCRRANSQDPGPAQPSGVPRQQSVDMTEDHSSRAHPQAAILTLAPYQVWPRSSDCDWPFRLVPPARKLRAVQSRGSSKRSRRRSLLSAGRFSTLWLCHALLHSVVLLTLAIDVYGLHLVC
jgi:hypothetical protein